MTQHQYPSDNEAGASDMTNADGSNAAGGAGSSFSGFSFEGNGNGRGPGGNAYSGGTVVKASEGGDGAGANGSDIDDTAANTAGGGGFSESGTAEGDNAVPQRFRSNVLRSVQRRASNSGMAGGSVVDETDDRGTVTNDGSNTAGGAGTTFSGDADGGNGNGFGPGNAF